MDGLGFADVLQFEGFRFDRARGCLTRLDGPGVAEPVALGSRAFDVLALLAERQGQLVPKDEIMAAVWPGTAVEEGNLTVQISSLRRVLDRDRAQGGCIQTVPGRGYRFVAAVTRVAAQDRSNAASLSEGSVGARPRMSIVVLPFTNLSGDPDQQYFADGITDDLTTDLSRIVGMVVISRSTAFTYREQSVGAKHVGRELGVNYVLEGSVRRSGSWIRLNAQLIDVDTDAHLWAERFEGGLSDLFSLQDEITRRIAVALQLELVGIEATRPAHQPDALDYIVRGRAELAKPPTPDRKTKAIDLFERALVLEPQSVAAQSWLACALAGRIMENRTEAAEADFERAEGLIERALAKSPRNPVAHFAKAVTLRAQGRAEEAIPEFETVIGFDRNWTCAIFMLGQCKFLTGSIEEAIPAAERAIRLSPRDPAIGQWYWQIGMVHMLQSRTDEAILWFEKARSANPGFRLPHAYLASAYALKGEMGRAAEALAEARRVTVDDRYSSISRLRTTEYYGVPKVVSLFDATYFAGLRKAGMPEE